MTAEQLRNSILQEAISGRLVPQDPNDEPAEIVSTVPEDKIPFEVPSSWRWVRMQDVLEFINGRAYKKEELLSHGKYKVLRVGNFFTNQSWYYSDLELAADKYCYNGDLLYAWSASFGPRIWEGEKTIFHYHIWNVKFDKEILFREYMYYFFLYDISQVKKSTTGSTMIHVSMENMKPRLIPLPPLAEQKRIVAKLEELLPIVEQYGKAQKELDELNAALPARLRQSILQEAISGKLVPQDENDEPASALLARIREEKARLVKEGKLKKKDLVETPITDDEKPFEIPETWNWCRLGELAFERMGKTPPRGESEYWLNAKYPWVSISDMKDYGHVKMTKERVSEYAAKKAFRQISPIGSLLMSFKLTVGRTSILDIAAYHNEAIITIQPYIDQEFAFRNYLFYVLPLIANLGDSKDAIKGKTLNSTSLYNLYIPLPPLAEQQRIVAKIEELFEQIDKISK